MTVGRVVGDWARSSQSASQLCRSVSSRVLNQSNRFSVAETLLFRCVCGYLPAGCCPVVRRRLPFAAARRALRYLSYVVVVADLI